MLVFVLLSFKDVGTLCSMRLHADRLPLMNNNLEQCKTSPLIMMHSRAMFQHDSPQRLFFLTDAHVPQSCPWTRNNATVFVLLFLRRV